jgi:hypothetical protein
MKVATFPRFLLICLALWPATAEVYDFQKDCGGLPNDTSSVTEWANGAALNATLAKLQPGDELVFAAGATFNLMGGIMASGLRNVTLRFDSALVFSNDIDAWPRNSDGGVLECLYFDDIQVAQRSRRPDSHARGVLCSTRGA